MGPGSINTVLYSLKTSDTLPTMSLLYSPSRYGVEIVASLDSGDGYLFRTLLVVRSLCCNKIYAAYDSGCSCPTPFEDHKFPQDWQEITGVRQVDALVRDHYGGDDCYSAPSPDEILTFKKAVRDALPRYRGKP
jgi:hypothetical protein